MQALQISGLLIFFGLLLLLAMGYTPALLGFLNILLYNFVYTPLKRYTAFSIIPGAMVGSVCPLIGWSAGNLSVFHPVALFLSLFVFLWQIPHFWLLLLHHSQDYQKAGFNLCWICFERMKKMELENNTARRAYIQLLVDTLKKKSEVLNQLMELTLRQESLITSDELKEEEFSVIISSKEEQINMLSKLDEGFEKLYESVQEELLTGREKYRTEITTLQELIITITDTSVKLQALEKRNKLKMEAYFSNQRKKIRNSRLNNKTVTNYYKTMTKQNEIPSFFYDKKN
jgi:flagellar biosynthesis/type III secretory pathway chaperone